ncbi:MAG: 1-deoxy-D-xylulose-5-phosphate synthase, partial [Pelagibacteraceae bacterium]|nr:1-deoxy-D-xylulose-5-phosphate synthase [Pelagibacteraceae bacterium]
ISVTVADMRFAKPIDQDLILELCLNHEALITIEEGSIGGFGSHVMQFLSNRGIFDKGIKLRSMILPDIFIDQDTQENIYKKAGLDSISIEEKVLEALKSNVVLSKAKSVS